MIAQGFGFTRDFLKEWNNTAYCRLKKITCGFKEQARARHPGEKCGLASLLRLVAVLATLLITAPAGADEGGKTYLIEVEGAIGPVIQELARRPRSFDAGNHQNHPGRPGTGCHLGFATGIARRQRGHLYPVRQPRGGDGSGSQGKKSRSATAKPIWNARF